MLCSKESKSQHYEASQGVEVGRTKTGDSSQLHQFGVAVMRRTVGISLEDRQCSALTQAPMLFFVLRRKASELSPR